MTPRPGSKALRRAERPRRDRDNARVAACARVRDEAGRIVACRDSRLPGESERLRIPQTGIGLEDGLAAYCAGSTAVTPPNAFTCSVQELPIANCWNSVSLPGP